MPFPLSPTDYGSGNFGLPDELMPYFYGPGESYGAGTGYGPDEAGSTPSPRLSPPPVPTRSRYRQDLEEAIANPPKMPEATWGKGILSGLIGGLSGYLNASPSRQFRIDPTQTIERIRYGDYPQRLSEWQQRLKGLQSLEELQRADVEDIRKQAESQALVNQRNASADYYNTGRKQIVEMQLKGKQDIEDKKDETRRLASTFPITQARSEYIKEMLEAEQITPEQAQDPNFRINTKAYDTWIRANTMEDQVALKRELADAHEFNTSEIAKLRTDASRYRTDKQFTAAMARVEEMRKRTEILKERAASTGNKTDDEAVTEYRRNNEKAENDHLNKVNALNRRFRIGAGTEFSPGIDAPEKLPTEQRKQYFSELFSLEQRLVNAKKSAERLFSYKTRKEPEFSEIEAPHLDNLARYAELSESDAPGTSPAATKPSAPAAAPAAAPPKPSAPATKPGSAPKGEIKESAIIAKFGKAGAVAAIAEAERRGYKVLRGQ